MPSPNRALLHRLCMSLGVQAIEDDDACEITVEAPPGMTWCADPGAHELIAAEHGRHSTPGWRERERADLLNRMDLGLEPCTTHECEWCADNGITITNADTAAELLQGQGAQAATRTNSAGGSPAEETTMDQEYTLEIAIADYLDHLDQTGKSPSTIGTARRTLTLFQRHLGPDKRVAKILPVHVAGFYNSEAATTQPGKDGPKPRAKQSILQIRRIVRDALVWWNAQGSIATVPLPKDERKFLKTKKVEAGATEPAADNGTEA